MKTEKIVEHNNNIKNFEENLLKVKHILICPDCNKEVSDDVAFCPSCGYKLTD